MTNPIDNPDQIDAERTLIALLKEERVQAAQRTVAQLWKVGWQDSPPEEVRPLIDAYLQEYFNNWLIKAIASDGQHPRFIRDFMPAYSWHGHDMPGACAGGDNTDNTYRLAGIEHGASYRVTGQVLDAEPANVSLTLTANYGTSVTVQTLELHNMDVDSNGGFVITIDDQPANGRRNHMTTAPHVKFLYVRDSKSDWAKETPLELHIERVGKAKADPISLDEIIERGVTRAREDVGLYYWFQSGFTMIKPNALRPAQGIGGATGGLVTQSTCRGHFHIGEDDAVIYDYDPAGAGYVAVQLSDWFLRSLGPKDLQSSLTESQSHKNADGRIRLVISQQDPGAANWLQCGGFQDILTMHRWQRLPENPTRAPYAVAKVVKLDQLKKELPADTLWFTAGERAGQIAARHAAYNRRITPNAR